MLKKLILVIVSVAIIASLSVYIHKRSIPKQGTILRYEAYKGCQVPIIADGKGKSYRWIADVPWNNFTIEEKFDMARVNGGYLSKEDIAEIWFKFGEWKKAGELQELYIYKKE